MLSLITLRKTIEIVRGTWVSGNEAVLVVRLVRTTTLILVIPLNCKLEKSSVAAAAAVSVHLSIEVLD